MALRNCQGWDMDISQKSGIPLNHPSRLRIRSTKTQIPIKTVILHPITLVHLSIFGELGGSSYVLVKPTGFGYPVAWERCEAAGAFKGWHTCRLLHVNPHQK